MGIVLHVKRTTKTHVRKAWTNEWLTGGVKRVDRVDWAAMVRWVDRVEWEKASGAKKTENSANQVIFHLRSRSIHRVGRSRDLNKLDKLNRYVEWAGRRNKAIRVTQTSTLRQFDGVKGGEEEGECPPTCPFNPFNPVQFSQVSFPHG